MRHVDFTCGACGLRLEADVDAKPASGHLVRAFWCAKEGRGLALDVERAGFRGRCPACDAQLELLADFPLDACPRCHAPTGVEKTPRVGTSVSREGGTGLAR